MKGQFYKSFIVVAFAGWLLLVGSGQLTPGKPLHAPSLTTTAIGNLAKGVEGDLVYDSTTNTLKGFDGGIWNEIGLPVFNVRSYGAIGDGVATDSDDIQQAVDAARTAGGGIVYLPDGTYKQTANIVIANASNVHIRGAGKGRTKIVATGDLGSYTPDETSTGANILFDGCDHCSVDGMTINKTAETVSHNGVSFWYDIEDTGTPCSYCTVSNVEIIDDAQLYQYLIWVLNGQYCRVLSCDINGGVTTPDGDSDEAHDAIEFFGGFGNLCDGCTVRNCRGVAVNMFQDGNLYQDISTKQLRITNLFVENAWIGINMPSAATDGQEDISITHVQIVEAEYRAVQITSSGSPIIGVTLENINVDGCDEGIVVFVANAPTQVNNRIVNCSVRGAVTTDQGAYLLNEATNWDLIGCSCYDTDYQAFRFLTCSGINMIGCRTRTSADKSVQINAGTNFTIRDCVFGPQVAHSMVRVDTGTSIYLDNNTFNNTGGTQTWAVFFSAVTGGGMSKNRMQGTNYFSTPFIQGTSTAIDMSGQINPPSRISTTSFTMLAYTPYTYTGGATTWTLPDSSAVMFPWVSVKNAGSGNLTVQRAGSSDTIVDTATGETSIVLGVGDFKLFRWNGSEYVTE